MRKLFLTIAMTAATLAATAQTVDFTFKNGGTLSLPTSNIASIKMTTVKGDAADLGAYQLKIGPAPAIKADTVSYHNFSYIDNKVYYGDKDTLITTQCIRERIFVPLSKAEDYGLQHVKYEVEMSSANYRFNSQNFKYTTSYGQLVGDTIDADGYLSTFPVGTDYSAFRLYQSFPSDYSPEYTDVKVKVTEYLKKDGIEFTTCDSTTLQVRLQDRYLEDTYYVVGDFNNWQISSEYKLCTEGKGMYSYNPIPYVYIPTVGGAVNFSFVPGSAVNGTTYDKSKAIGLPAGESAVYRYGCYYPNDKLVQGTDLTVSIPDSLHADMFKVEAQLMFDYARMTPVFADDIYNNSYTCLGFTNPEKDANGNPDINYYDSSTTSFIRQLWATNELTTDEFVWTWDDSGLYDLDYSMPDASNTVTEGLYARLQKGVSLCNMYLAMNLSDAQKNAEVRTLRAIYNYYLLDLYGNVPLYTGILDYAPQTVSRSDLYSYVESELQAVINELPAAQSCKEGDAEYGKMNREVAEMFLARLYLNAEVYTGTAQWQNAREYAKKIIESGTYSLSTSYRKLFMGDNGQSEAANEAILPIAYDGKTATTWGGTTYMIGSMWSYDMGDNGASLSWSCTRALPTLVDMFDADDERSMFYTDGRIKDAFELGNFNTGYSVTKWTNVYSDGGTPHDSSFPDTDFFLLRLAEAYLTYAEADARLNGRVSTEDAECLNALRKRANATTKASYTLDDILGEWGREFYAEGRRRTDLIRFGKLAGTDYLWQWKGGEFTGTGIDSHYSLLPIPQTVLDSNPNAVQNPGY